MKKIYKLLCWLYIQAKPELLHILLILGLGAVLSGISVYRAVITRALIDAAVGRNLKALIAAIVIFFSAIIVDMLVSSIKTIISNYTSTRLLNNLQNKLYSHILYSRWDEQVKFHSGELLTRLNSDAAAVNALIVGTIPGIISSFIYLCITFITIIFFDYRLAFIAIVLTPVCIIISQVYGRKYRGLYLKSQENEARHLSFLQETIQNIVIVKTFCQEKRNSSDLGNIQQERLKLGMKRSLMSAKSNFILYISSSAVYSIAFIWGALRIFQGTITFGTLTAMTQLVNNLQSPFHLLARAFPQAVSAFASSERLMEIEDIGLEDSTLGPGDNCSIRGKYDTRDGSKYAEVNEMQQTVSSCAVEGPDRLEPEPAGISFRNISFSYNEKTPILKDVTFSIEPGQIAALVGPSGEGKTTLVRLVLSLIYSSSGSIYLTGNSKLTGISPAARRHISYVPQGNILFSGTIEENLRYGNQNASEEELEIALRLSCAWDFVSELKEGIKTEIGEKGLGLSEGQVQRLAIARALLRKAPVLILDEVTSALDPETERKLLDNIRNLKTKPTCIIITHRLTALRVCDRVFKLEDKKLEEVNIMNTITA